MTLESFAADLKKARVEKQISLMDISASTRINMKFLEALEEGNFSVLPQTYVRAFIREYADAVGYNVQEAMKQYDALTQPKQVEKTESTAAQGKSTKPAQPSPPESQILGFARQNAVFIGIIVVVAIFVVYLTRPVADTAPIGDIAETPFDKVVQENQAATPITQQPITLPSVSQLVTIDSLTLDMTSSDSVWMTITLDGTRTMEYLFPPSRKGSWKAKESFTLTMGNAGGASFSLNGHDLGTLGRPGAVVRNVVISEANLPKQ
jgi:cytoskeletal protein RodZ